MDSNITTHGIINSAYLPSETPCASNYETDAFQNGFVVIAVKSNTTGCYAGPFVHKAFHNDHNTPCNSSTDFYSLLVQSKSNTDIGTDANADIDTIYIISPKFGRFYSSLGLRKSSEFVKFLSSKTKEDIFNLPLVL